MADLWPHQAEAIEQVCVRMTANRGGAGLLAPMGSGKTRIALNIAHAVGAQRILVVAPKVVAADVWPQQVAQWMPGATVADLTRGTVASRIALLDTWAHQTQHIGVLNYDVLNHHRLLAALQRSGYDMVILR